MPPPWTLAVADPDAAPVTVCGVFRERAGTMRLTTERGRDEGGVMVRQFTAAGLTSWRHRGRRWERYSGGPVWVGVRAAEVPRRVRQAIAPRRCYVVRYDGHTWHKYAKSAGGARMATWHNLRDAGYRVAFRDFLAKCHIHRPGKAEVVP